MTRLFTRAMMKVTAMVVCLGMMAIFLGCGTSRTVCIKKQAIPEPECHRYKQVGLFDPENENPDVEYEVIVGNVVWSVLLFPTIAVPLILLGWYLWEPVGERSTDKPPGAE